MKKKLSLLSIIMCTLMIILSGCGQKIKLSTAILNNGKINSYSYDFNVTMNIPNDPKKIGNSTSENFINTENASFNLKGDLKKDEESQKINGNVKISSEGAAIEAPIFINIYNKGKDFDFFVGIPGILKKSLGEVLANADSFYLSSKDLDELMKKTLSQEDYTKYNDTRNNNADNKIGEQVGIDIISVFNQYKDKKKLEKFEAIDKKDTSKNGIVTLTLNKDDVKNIVSEYLGNEKYFNNFKALIQSSNSFNEIKDSQNDISKLSSKEMIEKFNKSIDELKNMSISFKFTIEEEYVTKTNTIIEIEDTQGKGTININSSISNINGVKEITIPDKNADKMINVINLLESFGYSQ
ncbi:lipoprotein [Candidatus Clostridium stratigraminis]|uniref:Lipoprotein n=1 Tax=Candidatus Clostridium stratigraminis TaxID=3381661 RepID=A0ABW8T019_9CLOT